MEECQTDQNGMIEDLVEFLNNDSLSEGPSISNQRRNGIFKGKKNNRGRKYN